MISRLLELSLTRGPNIPATRNMLIKLYGAINPKPHQLNTMEFAYGLWEGISTIHCVDGRQLGESNAAPAIFREHIETRLHSGNLSDSRAGHKINITALHTVMQLWPELINLIHHIRQHYIKHFKLNDQIFTLVDIYLLSQICVSIPAYLARRNNGTISDGKIPAIVANQYKIIAGIFMIVRRMLEHGEPWFDIEKVMSAEELYAYTDAHGLFISPAGDKLACGGSKRKIIELMAFAINGNTSHSAIAPIPAVLANLEIIGNLDILFEYAITSTEIEIMTLLHRAYLKKYFLFEKNKKMTDNTSTHTNIKRYIENNPQKNNNIESQIKNCHDILRKLKSDIADLNFIDADNTESTLDFYKSILLKLKPIYENKQNHINSLLAKETDISFSLYDISNKLNIVPHDILKKEFDLKLNQK